MLIDTVTLYRFSLPLIEPYKLAMGVVGAFDTVLAVIERILAGQKKRRRLRQTVGAEIGARIDRLFRGVEQQAAAGALRQHHRDRGLGDGLVGEEVKLEAVAEDFVRDLADAPLPGGLRLHAAHLLFAKGKSLRRIVRNNRFGPELRTRGLMPPRPTVPRLQGRGRRRQKRQRYQQDGCETHCRPISPTHGDAASRPLAQQLERLLNLAPGNRALLQEGMKVPGGCAIDARR